MTCSACSAHVEKSVAKVAGVRSSPSIFFLIWRSITMKAPSTTLRSLPRSSTRDMALRCADRRRRRHGARARLIR
ncbi:MAG: hypothetical protein ACLVJ6_04730 [Merdibacter sp.]